MPDTVLHTGTVTEVTGEPETHIWALRLGFQIGKELKMQNPVCRVGCALATHRGEPTSSISTLQATEAAMQAHSPERSLQGPSDLAPSRFSITSPSRLCSSRKAGCHRMPGFRACSVCLEPHQ